MQSIAIFAGGCFWCMEAPFDLTEGVEDTTPGYIGGTTRNPTYEEVSTEATGHYEAIKIIFNPEKVSYDELVEIFFKQIDPTDPSGQFADRGSQYRTAIFYLDEEQKKIAEKAIEALKTSGKFKKPIATRIIQAGTFYPAESYHQEYYKKNPERYEQYKEGSGRMDFLRRTWQEAEA
jgi:peptide methionine sulfoxide reductase msrA/msrB